MPWAAAGMSIGPTSAALEMPISRAIDRDGAVVDVMLNEHRDLAATKAFLRSAKAVTSLAPDRVTTDGCDAYPRVIRTALDKRVWHRTNRHLNNCHEHGPTPTDARLQEYMISSAMLSPPRQTPRLSALPDPHAPTCLGGVATLWPHAQSGDSARYPGDSLRERLSGSCRNPWKARKLTEPE
jgi:hypothetical protein